MMTKLRRSSSMPYAHCHLVFGENFLKGMIFSFAILMATFFPAGVSLHAQQGTNSTGGAVQQTWKLSHLSAENAENMLLRQLPAETARKVIVVVRPETNEINLIGLASAVQSAALVLQKIDQPQAPVTSPYLNIPPNMPPANTQAAASRQETPLQPMNPANSPQWSVPSNARDAMPRLTSPEATNFAMREQMPQESCEPGTYFCKPTMIDMISRNLHQRYGGNSVIEISVEENGKILVWAPLRVHDEIKSLITQAGAWAEVPQGRDPREFDGTLVRFGAEPRTTATSQQPVVTGSHVPKYATLEQIETKLQTLFGSRMIAMSKQGDQMKKYRIAIPRLQNTNVCELTLDYPGYKIEIKGPQNLAGEMSRLLEAVDQSAPDDGYDRRFISIQNTDPEQMRKLLDTYRSKAVPTSSLKRHGGNMLAHRRNDDPANFRQVNYTTQDDGGLGGVYGGGTSPGFGMDSIGAFDPGFSGEAIGQGGGITLIPQPESKIQVLNDLDVVIIDAPIDEVRRIMEMIERLEELAEYAQPEIEVMFLKHVQCEALDAILRTQLRTSINPTTGQLVTVYLYTEMFAAKQGRVWVIPLHNPNAMLLVGWGESLEAMKAMIEQLDQPVVEANSLLRVVQLEHASAMEVGTVLGDYFTPTVSAVPGFAGSGFQPRIRVLSDTRTNTLIIQAAPNDYRDIERVIAALDVGKGSLKLQVKTFRMKNMLAEHMATALQNSLDMALNGREGERLPVIELVLGSGEGRRIIESGFLTDVTIEAVAGNNTVVVTAPGNCMPLIGELIDMIDQSPGTAMVKVIRIEHSDAETIQRALQTLLPSQMAGTGGVQLPNAEDGESFIPIKFAIDQRSNSIIVAGSDSTIFFIETLIKSLDKKDAIQREVKTIHLRNSSANDVSTAISRYLEERSKLQNEEVISPYQRLESAAIVVPDPISNTLIVNATEQYMTEIEKMITELDQEPPQVMVQVLIAEVTLGSADEFGIELGLQDPYLFSRSSVVTPSGSSSELSPGYDFNDPSAGLGNSNSAESLATAGTVATQMLSNFATGRVNSDTGFGGLVFSASSDAVSVLIRAMQERSRVEILSRPQITAQDNQLAIIFVGQKVARAEGADTANGVVTSRTVDKDVGLFLGVVPRISKGRDGETDKIVMLISASKSSLGAASDGQATVVSGTVVRTPNINQTRTETIVSAQDGETVLLGGLISTDKQEVCRGVPYLSNIPIVGNLFKYEYEKLKRSELIFIMRPRIIQRSEDMEAIRRVEFARMNWCLADVTKLHGDVGVYNPMARQPVTGGAPTFVPAPVDMSELKEIPMPQNMNSNGNYRPSTTTISTDAPMGVSVPSTNSQLPMPSTLPSSSTPTFAPAYSTVSPDSGTTTPRPLSPPVPDLSAPYGP